MTRLINGTVALFALAEILTAQDNRFEIRKRLVLVPVAVTDADETFVDGLGASDFSLLANGRPQTIAVDTIATGVPPIALIVAVQSAGISAVALEKVRKVGSMFQPLVAGERGCVGVLAFHEKVRWLQDCTSDQNKLSAAFRDLQAGLPRKARMLDAVREAVTRLETYTNARRVLLLISEARDRGSETDLNSVAIAAQAANVTVYTATYSAFAIAWTSKSSATGPRRRPKPDARPGEQNGTRDDSVPNKFKPAVPNADNRIDLLAAVGEWKHSRQANAAETLAEFTGGVTLPFLRQQGLEDAIQKLSVELHTQYTLSFSPESLVPGFTQIEVRVVRPGLNVRARAGYWLGASK